MLSKEEIEKAKECLQETIQNTYAEGKAIKLNNALKYIDHLESDKQKLIEKLEEVLKSIKQDGIYGYDEDILEILSILKGKKS